jgi:hypothetical protein
MIGPSKTSYRLRLFRRPPCLGVFLEMLGTNKFLLNPTSFLSGADPKDYNVSAMQQVGVFEVLQKDDAMRDLYGAIQRGMASSK